MIESVGDQWGEYLRLSRRMSEHTIAAYLGDLRALLDYVGLRWDAPAGEFGQALTHRSIRSWLAHTLASGGARATRRPSAISRRGPCARRSWRTTRPRR